MGSPAEFPQNDFTRAIEELRAENRSGIRRSVGVASATPMPTVQSAAVGRPVEEPEALSLEEREALDKAAIEAGVMDPRLGNMTTDGQPIAQPQTQYGSLEEAIAAGAPVNRPVPTTDPTLSFVGMKPVVIDYALRTKAMAAVGAPRIPDFTKIEGIDLVHNRVVMDGLDFPITEEQSAEFKTFVMGVVRDAILAKLEAATEMFVKRLFPEGTDGDEAVLEVQGDEGGH